MTEYSLIEALLLGLLYMYAWTEFFAPPIPGLDIGTLGVFLGLCYGDVTQGAILGGTLGMIYISNFAYGAAVPSDTNMAGVIAIPMAIKFGFTSGEALALAVPFGVLGALIDNVRRAFAGTWWRMAQKMIQNRKYGQLIVPGLYGPLLQNFICRCLPVTILLYLFGTAGGNAISNMPAWLSSAFAMMGVMLPGVGLVICISIMGNRSMLPYAVIGFFLMGRFGFTMVEVAVMGIVLGFLHTLFIATEDEEEDDEEEETEPVKGMFSTGQMIWFAWYWCCLYRASQCMEYFYGTGNATFMYPLMKKIYKDNPDGLQKGMERCLEPWITHPMWGLWMLGAQFAMEEDINVNGDPDGTKGQAISAMKTGFMGPFAGIGDTISGSVLLPIFRSFAYSTLLTGNPWGFLFVYLGNDWFNEIVAWISVNIGYKAGISQILKIIGTPLFTKLLTIAIVTGMITMGALSASYVRVQTTMEFVDEEAGVTFKVQEKIDQIMPNLLTFIYMIFLLVLQTKNVKTTTMMLITVAIALVGAIIGLW